MIFRIHFAISTTYGHIVYDFSHTFFYIDHLWPLCVRFFAYILPYRPLGATLCTIFRIHIAISTTCGHFVYDFSYTFFHIDHLGPLCVRFFAYILSYRPIWATLCAIFRIHFAISTTWGHFVYDFSHTFCHIDHLGPLCVRFFVYISPGPPRLPSR
jgi:hypothetical protein